MTTDFMKVIEDAGGKIELDFLRYVVTRHDPHDVPEAQIVAWLRYHFRRARFASNCVEIDCDR